VTKATISGRQATIGDDGAHCPSTTARRVSAMTAADIVTCRENMTAIVGGEAALESAHTGHIVHVWRV